jgi:hypothetical protein
MKNLIFSTLFALITTLGFSQLTYVPDDAFEAYLESLGSGLYFSNGIPNDNYINSANIPGWTTLIFDGSTSPILDFTGIEAFTDLTEINLTNFFSSTVDISAISSNAMEIIVFSCPGMINLKLPAKISYLKIQANSMLKNIIFSSNTQFCNGIGFVNEFIDIRYNNSIEFIDLSSTSISSTTILIVETNSTLKCLNLHNGYCYVYSGVGIQNNNQLACVEVDDPIYSASAGTWLLDAPAIYSTSCANCIANVDELPTVSVSISPNPTTSKITVKASLVLIGEEFTIYDQLGKAVKSGIITAEETEIDLSNLSEGVYLFKAGTEMQETFKIIKQ